MKLSTTKQVLKDSNKFHTLCVPNASFKKLLWWTQSLGSLFSHSVPSVHQNKSFGKASLCQIKCCSQHSLSVLSTTVWLLYCISLHSSRAALLLRGGSRTSSLLCRHSNLAYTDSGTVGLNSLLLIPDKSKMTHEDKGKLERAVYFLPHAWTPKH